MEHKAKVGSVLSGTLRSQDVLRGLYNELAYLTGYETAKPGDQDVAFDTLNQAKAMIEANEEPSEDMETVINELFDELNEIAPPYCYFGAHEGDGADFGFWPIMDLIEELPRVSDPSEAGSIDDDHCFVNDHGNVTVYGADGSVLLELV